jgi:cytochrome P450
VSVFSAPLPIAVITELLGVPNDRGAEFARFGATIGSALDGVKSLRHARALMHANASLEQMFAELFALRRREPTGDVLSAIVAAEGSQVTPAEMVPMCTLLLIAGFETTVNLVSNGVLALLDHREQWEALCADPSLAAGTVEEVLRYDPPVQRTGRIALADVAVGGADIGRGSFVVTLLGAAGRDPAVYDKPGRFDITRRPAVEHLAFSSGIHYCLGAALARLEGEIGLQTLFARFPELTLAGSPTRRGTRVLRGYDEIPVRLSRRSAAAPVSSR